MNNSAPVSEGIRARVLDAAAHLGYGSSPAKANKANGSRTVAVLITDILNPFFPELIRGIDLEARQEGTGLLLLDTAEDTQAEENILRQMSARVLDGVIVCGSRIASEELINFSKRYHVPLVVINRVTCPDVPCVRIDFQKAVYHAARHLINLGHRRIAYLAGPGKTEVSLARRSGLVSALHEAGLDLPPEYVSSSFPNVAGGFQAMTNLLALPPENRPTAVQAYNDLMALGALQAIRAYGLSVPGDLSVIGFDDITLAAHSNPPLTTIEQPKQAMGRLAMQVLRELMLHQSGPGSGYVVLESRLIVRESTGPVCSG
jgi:DNA-binding LacI/PurR family transcriptional regulator